MLAKKISDATVDEAIQIHHDTGKSWNTIANELGVKFGTLYQRVQRRRKKKATPPPEHEETPPKHEETPPEHKETPPKDKETPPKLPKEEKAKADNTAKIILAKKKGLERRESDEQRRIEKGSEEAGETPTRSEERKEVTGGASVKYRKPLLILLGVTGVAVVGYLLYKRYMASKQEEEQKAASVSPVISARRGYDPDAERRRYAVI